ncbi:MAG: nitrilase family protein [Bacteroidales bacterium]|nr:nitrilase family protein [Bacteroidales bacterium]
MRITLLQTAPTWADPQRSREDARRMLMGTQRTDLVVLPEMFSTGFITAPEGVAEGEDGDSLRWMKEYAASKGCAVAGSVSVRAEDGSYRNRFYFVYPDGRFVHYDKRHLFTYAGEHGHYRAGEERVIVEHAGFRILLQVCYDLRFPVFARNRMVDGRPDYDLILYVASWPQQRVDAWDALLKARAIENVCFVAGVNRVGKDPGNLYSGHTGLYGPRGEQLSICKENRIDIIEFEIKKPLLDTYRSTFPALLDADSQ